MPPIKVYILIKSLPSFQLKSLPLIEWYKRGIPLLFKDDKHEFEARNNNKIYQGGKESAANSQRTKYQPTYSQEIY
jgi:hypothetical protein